MEENDFFGNVMRENKRQFDYMLESYHELETTEDDG